MAEVMPSGTQDPESRPLGVRLERVPMLNDDPLFVEALAETVETHAAAWLRGPVEGP